MSQFLRILLPLLVIVSFRDAQAGKVEDVQSAVKKECSKDIPNDEALRLVKNLFLSCVPGSKVDLDGGCKVTCLKENGGAVVGK